MSSLKVEIESCFHRKSERLILREVKFETTPNQRIAFVGESGAGKTVLFNAVLGFLDPAEWEIMGSVRFNDIELLQYGIKEWETIRGRQIRYLLQNPSLAVNPGFKVGYQLEEALEVASPGISPTEVSGQIRSMLKRLRLDSGDHLMSRYPSQLSKGQLQRLGLALTLLAPCKLLFVDEPFNFLDSTVLIDLLELLKESQASGKIETLVMISHDLNIASVMNCDQYYLLQEGRIIEKQESLHGKILFRSQYGKSLQEAATFLRTSSHAGKRKVNGIGERRSPPASDNAKQLLVVDGISSGYWGKGTLFPKRVMVIRNVSMDLKEGEFLGVIGNSGEGKSTLGLCIADIIELFDGHIQFGDMRFEKGGHGEDKKRLRNGIHYLVQDAASSFDPAQRILDNLMECAKGSSLDLAKAQAQISRLSKYFLLEGEEVQKFPHQLSGGQKQRCAIIRSLLGPPKLLIADEPFAHLDVFLQIRLIRLLDVLKKQKGCPMSCILISHDLGSVLGLCERIVFIHNGRLVGHFRTGAEWNILNDTIKSFYEAARSIGYVC